MQGTLEGKRKFRGVRSLAAAVLLTLPFAGGLELRAWAAETTVILGTQPYPGEASIFVALEKGFFTRAGLNVVERRLPSGRLTMDAMLSGAIDIATPVETGPMFAIANGSDLAILAQVSTNAEEVKPAVRVDAGVSAPTDLKGKRLGYGAGSSNQFAMYNWLKAGNIPASEVTLVNLQPADLVTALIGGSIDVAFTWEPFLSAALKKSNGTVKIIEGQNLYRSRLLLVAKPVWTKANTDTVSKVATALAMAADWMRSNKSEAVQITSQAIGMDPAELSSIFDRWSFDVELTKGLIQSFNDQFAWASQANLLPPGTKKPDFSKSFFPDGLKAVRAQAIDY